MEHPGRVTSSVIFVSELGRSVDFYRDPRLWRVS
jgi:hypothetical protein